MKDFKFSPELIFQLYCINAKINAQPMNFKKELREWGIFLAIIAILYFTGLYTDVAAFAQRIVLTTGLITPDTEITNTSKMDYDFSLIDIEGKVTPMADYKGKVIFINEWATWCAPCVAEMPGIQNLYDEIGENENIVFIMLSMDDSSKKVEKFIDRKGFTFPVYGATGPLPNVLRSGSIPTTFVVSKSGEIITKKTGMAKYDTEEFTAFLLDEAAK